VANLALREATEADGPAIERLAAASADTGAIRFSPRFARNPVEVARLARPGIRWVLAERGGELAGGGQVSFGELELEGELRPYALLSTLMVHPSHRRQGVARALTDWRLEQAGDRVIVAGIQSSNAGSFANARRWATQVFGALATPPIRMRARSPRLHVEVREAGGDDWAAAAAGLARFEAGWNLRVPETAAGLEAWAALEPFGMALRHYLVAVDGGEVVAGASFAEAGRLSSFHVEHLPPALRTLNLALRIVPRDGVMRQVGVARFWHAPGRADAARELFENARWRFRDAGNALLPSLDLRGPLRHVLPLKPWTPRAVSSVAVRSPVQVDESRLLAPLL
jgi:GNAT superfamily N-acetyltransferase